MKQRINSKFVNLVNKYYKIVTQDLTKGFVGHRDVGFGPKRVTELALHHTERRFDIRPMFGSEEKA